MNEYKYIEEQGIDKLIELGYSWEEAKKFLTKTTEEMLA